MNTRPQAYAAIRRRWLISSTLCVLWPCLAAWGQTETAATADPERAPPPTIGPSAITVTVDLTASPLTGTCPYQANLQWTATNASTCTKTGAWAGSAPASGSESVTVNAAQQTHTITCSSSIDSRTVSWTNPTQNVDGTAATLSGNKLFHHNTSDLDQSTPITITPAKQTFLLTGLPAGPRYIGVKATGPAPSLLDSTMSNVATVTITLPTGSDTVQVGCTTPPTPKPPTNVTIATTVWDVINTRDGPLVGQDVGTIPLEVRCTGKAAWIIQQTVNGPVDYWLLPKTKVTIHTPPRSKELVGLCDPKPAA